MLLPSSRTAVARAGSRTLVALTLPQAYALTARNTQPVSLSSRSKACPSVRLFASTPQNNRGGAKKFKSLNSLEEDIFSSGSKGTRGDSRRLPSQSTQYRSPSRQAPDGKRPPPFRGPGNIYAKNNFGKEPSPAPTYALPSPPQDPDVLRHASNAIQALRIDPYVLATFDRFGMANASFTALLKDHGRCNLPPLVSDVEVPRLLFDKWCTTEHERILQAHAKRKQVNTPEQEQWQTIKQQVTPLISASLQHHNPDTEISVMLFRYFYQEFASYYQTLIQTCIDRQESSLTAASSSSSLPQHSHALQAARSGLRSIQHLFAAASLERPAQSFSLTRPFKRSWHLHVGPTNSGKTYGALLRLVAARTGAYLGPLRLLAHEVWDRISRGAISPQLPARSCQLKTGEEESVVDEYLANGDAVYTGLTSSTIEMANHNTPMDVAVIDEIQMIGDPQRGHAWTDALLAIKARELHLCGEPTTVDLIKKLAADCGDDLTIHEYERLTPLEVAEHSLQGDLSEIRPGDCIVAFSRSAIFALKGRIEQMNQQPGQPPLRCAVAYGSLPPDVRAEQAKIFNEGVHANVMVASDAIGMGLNLKIKRIVFEQCQKYNGSEMVPLSASQIKQIAGRAGRFGTSSDGSADGGVVTCLQEEDMPILRAALASEKADIKYAMTAPFSDRATNLRSLLPEVQLPGTVQDYASSPFAAAKAKGLEELEAREKNMAKVRQRRGQDTFEDESIASGTKMFSSTFADTSLLCKVNSDHYCLADFGQLRALSPIVNGASSHDLIDHQGKAISSLTHAERETFIKAPCNLRDPTLVKGLQLMVQAYTRQGHVDFRKILEQLNLTEAMSVIQSTMEDVRWLWKQQQQEKGEELISSLVNDSSSTAQKEHQPSVLELAQLLPGRSVLRPHFLIELESLHRTIMLYIWFSFRFPLAFLQGGKAAEYSIEIEQAIQFTLEGMRVGRGKRLQALGRDADTAKEEKKMRRQRNKEMARERRHR
ncbi:unnamed protein product [Sympodiomycopsis kandeliae]